MPLLAHRVLNLPLHFARTWWRRVVALRLILLWSLGLWLTVVAVPFAFLYPGDGLERPVCLLLALLAPLLLLLASASGEATLLLGAALAGLVPVLVACPTLHGPRTSGPVQGLWLTLVLLGLVRAVWNHNDAWNQDGAWNQDETLRSSWTVATTAHAREADLRRLWHWPEGLPARLLVVLAPLWLTVAWLAAPTAGDQQESARATRLVAVLLLWLAVRLVPLAGPLPGLDVRGGVRDRWPLWLGRRLCWLGLFGGLTALWK